MKNCMNLWKITYDIYQIRKNVIQNVRELENWIKFIEMQYFNIYSYVLTFKIKIKLTESDRRISCSSLRFQKICWLICLIWNTSQNPPIWINVSHLKKKNKKCCFLHNLFDYFQLWIFIFFFYLYKCCLFWLNGFISFIYLLKKKRLNFRHFRDQFCFLTLLISCTWV